MTFILGETTTVEIDSRRRLKKSPLPDDTNLFDIEFNLPSGNNYDRVVCTNLNIPHTFWQVQETELQTINDERKFFTANKFYIELETSPGVYTETEITVPPGNYSKNGIASVLTQLLDVSFSGATVTYPDETTETMDGKLTYSLPNPESEQFYITFHQDKSHSLMELLGFRFTTSNISRNAFPIDTISVVKSTYCITNRRPMLIRLESDLIHPVNKEYILETVSVTGSFDSISFQQNDIEGSAKSILNGFNKVHSFSLRDGAGNLLDLHGGEWTATLLFFKYNNEPLFQLETLKLKNLEKIKQLQKDIQKRIAVLQKENGILENNIGGKTFIDEEEVKNKEKEKEKKESIENKV